MALLAFMLWAHPSFVGLPYAALLFLAPPAPPAPQASPAPRDSRAGWAFALAGFVGALSAGLLVLTSANEGRLGAVTSAFIVLVTAAFVSTQLLHPRRFLRMGVRAVLLGMAATVLLVQIIWGTAGIGGLRWEVMRGASGTMRIVVAILPQWFGLYEPAVRFITLSWPIVLGLQALAGLAIAWQLHRRTAGVMPEQEAQPGTADVLRDTAPITT